MREREYYERQLSLLADVEGTRDAAVRKQEEMEAFLGDRLPRNLRGDDRVTYDNLVYELNDILRKMELQEIVDNYDELQTALTSEEAMDQELAAVDEIIDYRTRAREGGNTERAKDEATGAATAEPGKTFTAHPAIHEVDLTVDRGQDVVNETVEKARAQIRMNEKGRTTYSGSGLAASKQIATLRALLNSGREISTAQRNTINGMIRAFEKIIDREYDIEAQRQEREQGDEEEEVEVVTEVEKEVVAKDHIREKIAEQERLRELAQIRIRMMEIRSRQDDPNTPEEERITIENERAGLQTRAEELLGIGDGSPNLPDLEAQRSKLTEAERASLEAERAKIREEAQDEIDYADDVIPVLRELEQLENVPGLDFEAIDAAEVDKRLAEYRKQLAELEAQRGGGDDSPEMSDEELERRIKELEQEIQDEWNFRAHQENGMEEHADDKLEKLQEELKKLKDEQQKRKDRKELEGMSDEDIANRINEINGEIQDEWNFRAHQENGMEEHQDDKLEKLQEELKKLQDEQKRRKNQNELDGMSDEDIANRLKEIDEEIQDEWNFRAHQENGMEEHPDDKIEKLQEEKRKLQEEQERRKGKDDKDPELDRKIKRLKNIIKELESLERQKVKVKEVTKKKKRKKRKHPEPKPIPEPGGREPPGPIPPEPPKPPKPPKDKLPRHWVEIMADLQTESSGSIATYFHNMGKIQPFRMGITIWAFPIKGVMKGVGKLVGDGMLGVNRKKAVMRENLKKLIEEHPEEFDILVDGLTETNMRQYKVNEAFLDVVQEALTAREDLRKQKAIENDNVVKEAMSQVEDEIKRLRRSLDDPALTDDRRLVLQQQLTQQSLVYSTLGVQHAGYLAEQEAADKRVTDFDRGKTGKSTRKMNIQGWLAGSFNPDNREVHKQEAEMRRQMREAAAAGDVTKVTEMERQIEDLHEDNTHEIQLLRGTRFEGRARISRGKHKVEEVHQRSNDADQTKGRELIATIMTGVTLASVYHRWQANQDLQRQVDDHLDQHNQDIRATNSHNQGVQQEINQANTHNQGVQQDIDATNLHNQGVQQQINQANAHNQALGQQISGTRGTVTESQVRDAGVTEIHRSNAETYAIHHEAEFVRDNTPGVGFNHGGSDDAIHAAQPGMTASRTAAEQGSLTDITREATQASQRAQQAAQEVLPDVQPFTTVPGKGQFVNSEYIENLQHLASGGTSSYQLLQQLFKSVQQMGDPELVTGTVQDVSSTVQTVSGTIQDASEISSLVLSMPAGAMVDWLPFVTALVNTAHLEQQKAERSKTQYEREKKEREAQRAAKDNERDDQPTTEDQGHEM